jgi:integrase
MPNLCSPKRAPRYRRHKATGQAIVTIDGKDIYLGKHGTAASREAYERTVGEWMQNGGRAAAPRYTCTVTELVIAYVEFASNYYRKDGQPTNEVRMVKTALKIVRKLYGRTSAIDFGPVGLKACRAEMIHLDWCRSHTNKQVDRIKRMFKWATADEMVPGSVYDSLRCVAGLRKGRTEAREGGKVKPIGDADVAATIEHLPAIVADMVQLQRLTGARPGEICDMRPGDINRRADVWEYVPWQPQDGAPRPVARGFYWRQRPANFVAVSSPRRRRLLLLTARSRE